MIEIFLTNDQIIAISSALQFSIDNGFADEYVDTETLFETNEKFIELVSENK